MCNFVSFQGPCILYLHRSKLMKNLGPLGPFPFKKKKKKEEVTEHLDDSVVSLASFHAGDHTGSKLFFACTGVIIESNKTTTSFLTSLSLVRSTDDDSEILHDLRVGTAVFSVLCCLVAYFISQ